MRRKEIQQATACIVGLESIVVNETEDEAAGTFSVHADLDRAASLTGESFGVHVESPRGNLRATGTGLPEDVLLDMVKEEGMDFHLDWLASSTVSDFAAQTSRDGIVSNQARLSLLPTSLTLDAVPAPKGGLNLTYKASSTVPDLLADIELSGMRIRVDAEDLPTGLTGFISSDRFTGNVATTGGALGSLDLVYHPLGGAPLAWDSDADAVVDLDLSAGSGERGRVILDDLESVEWLVDLNQESFVVNLQRSLGATGQSVDARVRLDDGVMEASAAGVPSTFSVAADLNPGLATHPLLDFVEPGDVLAAKVTASSVLESIDLRFTPSETSRISALHVEASQVPMSLEVHVADVGGGLVGRYTASGTLERILVDGEFQGDRVFIDATNAPTSIAFDTSNDRRTGSVTTSGGVLGGLEVAIHPVGSAPPTLPSALSSGADSFVVLDAETVGGEAVHVVFPAGVDLQSASWNKPLDSKQLSLDMVRSDAALRPSFAAVAMFPGESFEAVVSELPTLIRFDSPSLGVFDTRIEGAVATAELHVVHDRGDGLVDDLYVELVDMPAWVEVNAAMHAFDDAELSYRASGVLDSVVVEGVYDGTYMEVAMTGVPVSVDLSNHAVLEGDLVRTAGSLTASAPIGHVEAVVYPDGARVLHPAEEEALVVMPVSVPGGESGDLTYVDVSGIKSASWDVLMPEDRVSCQGIEDFAAEAGVVRVVPGSVRVLFEESCGKYANVRLENATQFGFVAKKGVMEYSQPTGSVTGRLAGYVEGLDVMGPDGRRVESVWADVRGITGTINLTMPGATEITLNGESVATGELLMRLGDRDPSYDASIEPSIDMDIDLAVSHLEVTLANGAYSKIQNAPDSQISLYQNEETEFGFYANLNYIKKVALRSQPDSKDPCKYRIRELIYETFQPKRDLLVAFDQLKASACPEKNGQRDRMVVELTDMPERIVLTESYLKLNVYSSPIFVDVEAHVDTSSGPLGKLRIHKPGVYGFLPVTVIAEDIPATSDTLLKAFLHGKAFDFRVRPSSGVVGRAEVGLGNQKDSFFVGIAATDVNMWLQFDPDGDTRYTDAPRYFFLDTGGVYVSLTLQMYTSDFGLGMEMLDLWADKVQVVKNTDSFWERFLAGDILPIKANGRMHIDPEIADPKPLKNVRVKINDQWYKIPDPFDLFT